jgi:hypothetical protein
MAEAEKECMVCALLGKELYSKSIQQRYEDISKEELTKVLVAYLKSEKDLSVEYTTELRNLLVDWVST